MSKEIINLDRLITKLSKLETAACVDAALEDSCSIIEAQAKINAPVNDGQLRQSITHTVENSVGTVGTNVEYAPYVEIGTGLFSSEGNGRQTP